MTPSSASGKTKRARARNAALMNLLATPGLGSLMAGRIVEGILQLLLALAGFAFVVVWFWTTMKNYYGQMFVGEEKEIIQHSAPLNILIFGVTFFALAWIWSLITSLSLMRRAKIDEVAALKMFAACAVKLDESKIQSALAALPQWQRAEPMITRTFEFSDFVAAMKFVNAVAGLAEAAQHGPDIDIRWNKVTLALTTHDSGGLTEKDFAFARQCDALGKN
jgi:4a-hydroxytetrahydrobiopterin dehydratase